MQTTDRGRAIVLGASMAGLLAARALADSYAEVVVVDRDDLAEDDRGKGHSETRRGVPHGGHLHNLLAAGLIAVEELFPGITGELSAAGAVVGDGTENVRWLVNGTRMPKPRSGLPLLSVSRPHLERRVRARVRALSTVVFQERVEIKGLLTDPARATVVGVRVAVGEDHRDLLADLVVDATGRRTRTPSWLTELGYGEVEEEKLTVNVGYTTQYYRLSEDRLVDEVSIDVGGSAAVPRGALCAKIEDGCAVVTGYGIAGAYPPRDTAGFHDFLKSLAATDIHEAVHDQEPLGDPLTYRFPANLRRRYERLPSFPDGLLVIGDAVCSFNPVYGQGITVAALGARVLREHVSRPGAVAPRTFLADLAARAVDHVWDLTTGADAAFPGVGGEPTEEQVAEQAYLDRFLAAAARDGDLLVAYARVAFLLDPAAALVAPEIQEAVARASVPTA
ncbi:NAD(P)/FAD-dependent oxidoreductase [Actinokineospora iranica]|uniref:Dehydrogenase (Flavoprotein) n=1 Tax=Actinokineospora iranica TaxID=1271860 RepID=A0A1G6S8C8_9PSEU|nr:FAD-binding monooxygenase [Actinokineospora iranica]SDD13148.1 Dehydrogenase (flavoprotein) [Actinokineospora iranica]